MAMFGGGASAGGYSSGIGGQQGMGGGRGRNADGWDEEYLGKAYDVDVIRKMIPYLKPYKAKLSLALIGMVVFAISLYIQPLLIGLTVTAGVDGDSDRVIVLLGIMLGLAFVGWLAQWMQMKMTAMVGTALLLTLRQDMYDHIQGLSLSFFDEMEVGRIISRLTSDVTVMQEMLTSGSLTFAADVIGLAIVVVMLLVIDWQLALVTFAIVPPLLLLMFYWAGMARKAFINVRIRVSELYGNLGENVSGVRTIQSLSREGENSRRFDQLNQQNRNAAIWAGMLQAAIVPLLELAVAIATSAVIVVGGIRAINAADVNVAVLFGVLTTFVVAVSRFFDPIRDLVLQYTMVQRAMAGGERIFEVLETEPRIKDRPDAIELETVEGRVDFDHVSFHYVEGIPVLKDFDLHVEPGETIALVGHTGSGKTTITSLISRGYDVSSGAVRVDGHDVRDIKRRSLTKHMGVVLQTPYLFSGTVRDNIEYGKPGATDEEIIEATKAVGAHDFVMALDGGYDHVLHQRGQNLSVGERQLLSFARAVLAAPRILILDEATAYVDTQTEVIIQRALRELLQNRTSFVIAHRLSTIREANRIVVLEQGEIVEVGTHEQLLERGGVYANLYKMAYEEQVTDQMVGEDEAIARRRHGDVAEMQAEAPGGQ